MLYSNSNFYGTAGVRKSSFNQYSYSKPEPNELHSNDFNSQDMQDDPVEINLGNPLYLTSRTSASKRLGDTQDGQFIDNAPRLPQEVQLKLRSMHPIDKQCYSVLKNDRGIAEPGTFFRFYRSGTVYEGQWYNSKPHGYGKNYYTNGGFYEGTFYNGLPHGYGRFINPNGDYYLGEVKFGRGNGQGSYHTTALRFKGCFKDNNLHGEGQEQGENYFFRGTYEYGCKLQGSLKYGNNLYEGGFENDQFSGKGVLTTEEGKYVGQFRNGVPHGHGQFAWKNGDRYRGSYRRGVRDGDGEYYNATNSAIVRGLWQRGKPQGDGQYVEPRGWLNKVIWNEGRITALK